ncbi:hypothetical protein GCM10011512_11310 [Tersicoccus solisilvae]|nr:hypothetical protein GCM10011512_11310 [Tersicoccus solisilvae]
MNSTPAGASTDAGRHGGGPAVRGRARRRPPPQQNPGIVLRRPGDTPECGGRSRGGLRNPESSGFSPGDGGGQAGAGPPDKGFISTREHVKKESGDAMAGQKIRIRLKSYDHEVIDVSARKIVETVTRAGATVVGPVPLPTEKNVYCVIRSPHKYKDSREHFEMRTHKRLIDIIDPTPKAVDSLMRLDLPADVNIEIKL